MFLAECAALTLALSVAIIAPRLWSNWFESTERLLAKLARRRGLAVVAVGLSTLVLRAALLPIEPVPHPGLQDEFSYLLAADTFAHGRITNPVHPLWVHFETFNVIQHPTYASKFPPGQGLFLAAGQVIFGHPFWGVWLSVGAMCAAICWMLQGWLPPFWALVGGLLVVIRLGAFSYWANSFWGGAVAATGGALVLGALPRIKRQLHMRDGALMALGLVLLANSRPYEGLIFSLPALSSFALCSWRNRCSPLSRVATMRVLALFFIVLALGGCLTAYYCWRVTGSATRMPYQVYESTYDPIPLFPWQSLRSVPQGRHAQIMNLYSGWLLWNYEMARSHPLVLVLSKTFAFGFFFLGPILCIPLLMLGFVLPWGFAYRDIRQRTRFLLLVACLSWASLLLTIYFSPHYAAPLTCVVYALLLTAMQLIRRWRRTEQTGLAIVRAVFIVCIGMLVMRTFSPWLHIPPARPLPESWCSQSPIALDRQQVLDQLDRSTGRQLVVVHYNPDHDPLQEWVYNGADIDNSKIIWAREMDPAENQRLRDYFKNRQAWLLKADEQPPKLLPYTSSDNRRPSAAVP